MHGPAANALTVLLFGLTGLAAFGSASAWMKLTRDREAPNERPTIPVHGFRSAATMTAIALAMLGVSLLWSALLALNSI